MFIIASLIFSSLILDKLDIIECSEAIIIYAVAMGIDLLWHWFTD